MASVWVRFNPGFTNGGGFPAEQFLLRLYSILLWGKSNTGNKFGGFLVSYISSVATLTLTTGKCAKR
jgi:hypothetical protein